MMERDPRTENCKIYLTSGGLVTGVELAYVPLPSAKYRLALVELIDEPTNGVGGPTVAEFEVKRADGINTAEKVVLAWPWPNPTNTGNPGTPGKHMITNGYRPERGELGPLAMYPVDNTGAPIGDMIGGLGLPNNHHISFRMTWVERGAAPPEDGDTGGGGSVDVSGIMAELAALRTDTAAVLALLRKHLRD